MQFIIISFSQLVVEKEAICFSRDIIHHYNKKYFTYFMHVLAENESG